jgi:hypothetical protein
VNKVLVQTITVKVKILVNNKQKKYIHSESALKETISKSDVQINESIKVF